jgi:hypothetical protein
MSLTVFVKLQCFSLLEQEYSDTFGFELFCVA